VEEVKVMSIGDLVVITVVVPEVKALGLGVEVAAQAR